MPSSSENNGTTDPAPSPESLDELEHDGELDPRSALNYEAPARGGMISQLSTLRFLNSSNHVMNLGELQLFFLNNNIKHRLSPNSLHSSFLGE